MTYKRPKNSFFLNLLASSIILLVLNSCGSEKVMSSSETETTLNQTPKIVFLNYTIKKDNNGKKTIDFVSSKKVEGKLKNQKKFIDDKGNFEDLICSQFNASSSTLSQQLIENPLLKHVEYVDETKNFKIAKMELDSAAFTVRLQLYPETSYIAIKNSREERPLILTKVSEL